MLKDKMNAKEFQEFLRKREAGRNSKFGAIPHETKDGRKFHSTWEANFYSDLLVLQQAGEIEKVELQVVYDLMVANFFITSYKLDFRVTYTPKSPEFKHYKDGIRYIDTKSSGTMTTLFGIKQRLMWALFNIQVEAVFDPSLKPRKNERKKKGENF